MSFHDVKGYYRTLGVDPDASPADIKRAYRRRVKQVHPDSGDGDTAAFQAITEAHEVLGSAQSRADYDRLCRTVDEARSAAAKEPPKPPPKGAARKSRNKRSKAAPKSEPSPETTRSASPEPVPCRRCGTISAQPRHLVLHLVVGLLVRSYQRRFEGAFCRACADKIAVTASLITWLFGWWSVPRGPLDTARALLRNLAGGEKPADANLELLSRQARAFAARGQTQVAGDLALQARRFGRDPGLDSLAAMAGPQRLKNRWRVGGWAFVVQALPAGLAAAWLIVQTSGLAIDTVKRHGPALIESAPEPSTAAIPIEDRRYVEVAEISVRVEPDHAADAVDRLAQFDQVTVIDATEVNGWLRVMTNAGLVGWAEAEALTPGALARTAWCAENAGVRPTTGEILAQSTTGANSLGVTNRSGRDAVVKLISGNQGGAVTVYVRNETRAVIDTIADGTYQIRYATGVDYSRACGQYLTDMTAYAFATPATFETARVNEFQLNQKVEITLSAELTSRHQQISNESFVTD